jgi:hypothetical protein
MSGLLRVCHKSLDARSATNMQMLQYLGPKTQCCMSAGIIPARGVLFVCEGWTPGQDVQVPQLLGDGQFLMWLIAVLFLSGTRLKRFVTAVSA